MIKHKLTKYQFIAFIQVIEIILKNLRSRKIDMKRDNQYMQFTAYIELLEEMSRSFRSKLVKIEHESSKHTIRFSLTAVECLALSLYYGICEYDPYQQATIQKIIEPIQQKLLS